MEWATAHAELIILGGQAAVSMLVIYLSMKFASKKEVAEARALAASAHHRLDVLDERLKGFPDYDVVNALKEDVSRMRETQTGTNTELRLLREIVQRMDDFLRNHK